MSIYLISALLAPAALLSPTCHSASLRVSSGRSAPPAVMAGFGGAAAPPSKGKKAGKPAGKAASKAANRAAKSAGLSAKRQWDSHTALVAAGGATTLAWARAAADEEWLEVGTLSATSEAELSAAAHMQKRLILEHAGRLEPRLRLAPALEAGHGADAGSVTPAAKGPPPEVKCGLVGLPDPGGFYSRGRTVGGTNLRTGATLGSGAAPPADSKGRLS